MTLDTAQLTRPPITGEVFETLLVGYDGSEEADAALMAAVERAGPGDEIAVIYVYPEVSPWRGHPFYNEAVIDTQARGRSVLEQAAMAASGSDAEVTLEMHEGSPAEVLARLAALRDADAILIGSRGLGPLRGARGSVSQELVRKASQPVTVVPHRALVAA